MAKTDFINAPIPGMSLTTEPGNRPWEQPPQLTKLSEVVDYYTDRFTDAELIDSILDAVSKDAPIYETVMGLINYSVMRGVHSIDVGMLVSPIVVEMIKTLAELNDIGYVVTQSDKEKLFKIDKRIAQAAIDEVKQAEQQRLSPQEEVEPVKESRGLMSKGVK